MSSLSDLTSCWGYAPDSSLAHTAIAVKTFNALSGVILILPCLTFRPELNVGEPRRESDMAVNRSPNYPPIKLGEAIELIRAVQKKEPKAYASKEVVARHLGYTSVNGASLKKLSALNAFGLLEANDARELRVSDIAKRILFPADNTEKREALAEAAMSPNIFRQLHSKWPEGPPSDETIKSYLVRQGFNENSVGHVVAVYRDALSLAEPESPVAESDNEPDLALKEADMQSAPHLNPPASPPRGAIPAKSIMFDMETISGQYSFDNADDLGDFISKLEKIKPLLPSKN